MVVQWLMTTKRAGSTFRRRLTARPFLWSAQDGAAAGARAPLMRRKITRKRLFYLPYPKKKNQMKRKDLWRFVRRTESRTSPRLRRRVGPCARAGSAVRPASALRWSESICFVRINEWLRSRSSAVVTHGVLKIFL
ncbi:hypothetical protein EVAR_86197_1 [Eumeta japonica]|uniref:Uncharacterized protein n=1 Tax=Eumeta variegata TaxID=151549 RepID=A0A4C1UCY5_EUMVA|nr:hypothetical protein EVAR_86197_1 [Eumeta japonica]